MDPLDKAANSALSGFANQAEVLVNTRLAADAVGATKMDRPEWVAVHPSSGEVYVTMTNSSSRTQIDDANPRANKGYDRDEGKNCTYPPQTVVLQQKILAPAAPG